jgi:shikimate kinase
MNKLYLVGMPAAGKTTTAKWLANKLGWDIVDLDEQISAISDMSIPALFSALGEEGFRELEAKCLRETRNLQNAVISCGGGTAAYHGNMDWMKSHGLTLYLNTSFDVLVQRIAENESGRPLFQGSNKQEIMEKLVELSEKRSIYYGSAKIIWNRSEPNDFLYKAVNQLVTN